MQPNRLKRAGVGAGIAMLAFVGGVFVGGHGVTQATLVLSGPDQVPAGVDLAPVWKAWNLLEEKHVSVGTTTAPLSAQDRVWGMIKGLASAYNDPYTVFMPPQEARGFQQEISGSFGGIGVEIGMRNDLLTVIAPLKGTPADTAGLKAGDLIVEVNGKSTSNMTIDDAIDTIRGEVGTVVTLTIAREGEREFLTIPVTRGTIEVPTLDTKFRDDGVFVISLYNFGGTAEAEMQKALREFVASGSTKLVLDLRGNPGGYLDAAVDMASYFLPLGDVVVTEDYGDKQPPVVHRSKGYDITKPNWRIAVLIDGGSASASEILAGALSQQGKAKLIGEKSFGKGSVQELDDITPDTSLKITIARWLTPNGSSISEQGLTPDLTVPYTNADATAGRDPQLDAAVQYVLTGDLVAPATEAASSTSTTTAPSI